MKHTAFLAILTAITVAAVPAIASANLQINANGFHRAVIDTGNTPGCQNHRSASGRAITCASGSRGTLTLFRRTSEGALCEIDFWPQSNAAHPWRATLGHQSNGSGSCAMKWRDASTLDVTAM